MKGVRADSEVGREAWEVQIWGGMGDGVNGVM